MQAGQDNTATGKTGYDPLGRLTGFYVGPLKATTDGGRFNAIDIDIDPQTGNTTLKRSVEWNYDALGQWEGYNVDGTYVDLQADNGKSVSAESAAGNVTDSATPLGAVVRQGNRYDAWHRLVYSVRTTAGNIAYDWSAAPIDELNTYRTYRYDALGRLIYHAGQRIYYSAAWQPIVIAEAGQVKAENVWSLAYVDAMVFQDRAYAGAMQRVYPLHDASYDVTSLVKLVDGVWKVTQRHLYEPYGKVWATLDGLWQPLAKADQTRWYYLHKGGYYTQDCLYHFGKRSYDPSRGQWLQRDPARYIDSLNLHEYLGSSPVNHVDPAGEAAHVAAGAIIGGLLGAGTYLLETAFTDKEFDLAELGLYTAAGAASGAVSAATFGAVNPMSSAFISKGVGAMVVSGVSGAAGGFVGGAIMGGGTAALQGGDVLQGMASGGWEGLKSGFVFGAISGGVVHYSGALLSSFQPPPPPLAPAMAGVGSSAVPWAASAAGATSPYSGLFGGLAGTFRPSIAMQASRKSRSKVPRPYKRPSGATTAAQRRYVQGKPCVECGRKAPRVYVDHKMPLVEEYFETGGIDTVRMRELDAIQPMCPHCSNSQGGRLSAFSKQMKKEHGLD